MVRKGKITDFHATDDSYHFYYIDHADNEDSVAILKRDVRCHIYMEEFKKACIGHNIEIVCDDSEIYAVFGNGKALLNGIY
jgi:hypothetical protein